MIAVRGVGDARLDILAGDIQKFVERRPNSQVRRAAGIRGFVKLFREQKRSAEKRPLSPKLVERHYCFGVAADYRAHGDFGDRIGKRCRQLADVDDLAERLRDAHRPRPDVRNSNLEFGFLVVRLNPDRLVTPRAGAGTLALLHREADERNAEGVDRFLVALGALVERLVEHVVIRAPQAAADDLLGEKR